MLADGDVMRSNGWLERLHQFVVALCPPGVPYPGGIRRGGVFGELVGIEARIGAPATFFASLWPVQGCDLRVSALQSRTLAVRCLLAAGHLRSRD